jgi:hypothetical protein
MVALLVANKVPDYFARVILMAATLCHLNLSGYYGGFEWRTC